MSIGPHLAKAFITMSIMKKLPWDEISVSFVRSSGPGGQKVNKVATKAVLVWHPLCSSFFSEAEKKRLRQLYRHQLTQSEAWIITSDRYRTQARNLDDCKKKLEAMVAKVKVQPKIRRPTKPTVASQEKRLLAKKLRGEKKKWRQSSE